MQHMYIYTCMHLYTVLFLLVGKSCITVAGLARMGIAIFNAQTVQTCT